MSFGSLGRTAPNIILITVDCLRRDRLGCYGYGRRITPHVDKLAEAALIFDQAVSCGPDTQSSFPSIMTSSYPFMYTERGSYDYLSLKRTTVAEVLKAAGYSTFGATANPFTSRIFGYGRSFDAFVDFRTAEKSPEDRPTLRVKRKFGRRVIGHRVYRKVRQLANCFLSRRPYPPAEILVEAALKWVRSAPRPYFIWFHLMDLHYPLLPRPEYWRRVSCRRLGRLRHALFLARIGEGPGSTIGAAESELAGDLYDAQLSYADEQIGRFLDEADDREEGPPVVAITADHGELLGERGRIGHGDADLPDLLLRVPLLVAHPGLATSGRTSALVSLVDLGPTLAEFAGARTPNNWHGVSLVPLIGPSPRAVRDHAIAQKGQATGLACAWRTERWKYVANYHTGLRALYDLQSDPDETRNLAQENGLAEEFEWRICTHFSRYAGIYGRGPESGETQETDRLRQLGLTPEEEQQLHERLRDLGYVD